MLAHVLVNVGCKALPGHGQYFHLFNMMFTGACIIIQISAAILKFDYNMIIADFVGCSAGIFCYIFIGLHFYVVQKLCHFNAGYNAGPEITENSLVATAVIQAFPNLILL